MEDCYGSLVQRWPGFFEGGHVLDVGTNLGYTSQLFARAVPRPYKVFAFEPHPFNLSLLQGTVEKFGLAGKVVPVSAALGAQTGTAVLWDNPVSPMDHRVVTEKFGEHLGVGEKKLKCPPGPSMTFWPPKKSAQSAS